MKMATAIGLISMIVSFNTFAEGAKATAVRTKTQSSTTRPLENHGYEAGHGQERQEEKPKTTPRTESGTADKTRRSDLNGDLLEEVEE